MKHEQNGEKDGRDNRPGEDSRLPAPPQDVGVGYEALFYDIDSKRCGVELGRRKAQYGRLQTSLGLCPKKVTQHLAATVDKRAQHTGRALFNSFVDLVLIEGYEAIQVTDTIEGCAVANGCWEMAGLARPDLRPFSDKGKISHA